MTTDTLLDTSGMQVTPTEERLLATLLEHEGQVVRRQDLVASVLGVTYMGPDEAHTLRVNISRLRKKLPADLRIETDLNFGYRIQRTSKVA